MYTTSVRETDIIEFGASFRFGIIESHTYVKGVCKWLIIKSTASNRGVLGYV